MVYECPQCKTPLPPGVMACAKCGLQFATPIPADATVPAPGTLPLKVPENTSYSPLASDSAPSRRVIAAVVALGIVLVAAAIFAIYTFSHTPVESAPPAGIAANSPPPPGASLPPSYPPSPYTNQRPSSIATNVAPVQLSGGSGSSSSTAASGSGDAALQGRWQAKNMDFYQFNADGSGQRGNVTQPAKNDSFTWVVTDNQLVLNSKKEERLTFSTGPDATILYLRMPDGHYAKFAKAGTT